MSDKVPIIIDNGSYTSKFGLAGGDSPSDTLRIQQSGEDGLDLGCPFVKGHDWDTITDWAAMEKVWAHVFKDLNVQASEHPLLLTEAPNRCDQ